MECYFCKKMCLIECGKCFCVLSIFGEKHNCPELDEGFFDDEEGSLILCISCAVKRFSRRSRERIGAIIYSREEKKKDYGMSATKRGSKRPNPPSNSFYSDERIINFS